MRAIGNSVTISLTALLLIGCAVTEQAPQALSVKVISAEQAKGCKFLDAVSANNNNTLSKNPELEARNKALNRVAELGGNALKINTSVNQIAPSGVGSIFSLSGEAYKCDFQATGAAAPSPPPAAPAPPVASTDQSPPAVAAELPPSRDTITRSQARLNALGFSVGIPDGVAGPRTRAAISKFQSSKGLPSTGELNAETLKALGV